MISSPPTESPDIAAPTAEAPDALASAPQVPDAGVADVAADDADAGPAGARDAAAPPADADAPPAAAATDAPVPSGDTVSAQDALPREAAAPNEVEPATAPTPAAPPPAADCGPLLKKTFPALFTGAPKPLKLRIQTDIQERAPGVFSKQALSAFFRRYTGSTSYLTAVSRAPHRFDLDGAPAGELSDEHRKIALDELTRRRGNQQTRVAAEQSRVALEEQQRRNRATLLHDFERTTLTPTNFCALKGIGVDELDGYLATARREAAERPLPPPAFDRQPARGAPSRGAERPQNRPSDGVPRPAGSRPESRPASRRR